MLLAGLIQAQPSPGTGQTGPAGPRWVTAHRYRGTQTHPSLWNCSFVPGAAVPRRQGTSHGIPISTKPSDSPSAAQGQVGARRPERKTPSGCAGKENMFEQRLQMQPLPPGAFVKPNNAFGWCLKSWWSCLWRERQRCEFSPVLRRRRL